MSRILSRVNKKYFGTVKDQRSRLQKTKGLTVPVSSAAQKRFGEAVFLLRENEYYVFEDTNFGAHNFRYSAIATHRFGAIQKKASGIQGFSYAIPTRKWDKRISKFVYLPFDALAIQFGIFRDFAQRNPQMNFVLTPMLQKLGKTMPGATFDIKDGRYRTGSSYEMDLQKLTQFLDSFFAGLKNVKYSWIQDGSLRSRQPNPMRFNKFHPYVYEQGVQPIASENDFAQYVNIKRDDVVLAVFPAAHPYKAATYQLLNFIIRQKPKKILLHGMKVQSEQKQLAIENKVAIVHHNKTKGQKWQNFVDMTFDIGRHSATVAIGSLVDPDIVGAGHALMRAAVSYGKPASVAIYQTGFPDGYGNGVYMAQINPNWFLPILRRYKKPEEDNADKLPPNVTQAMMDDYQKAVQKRRKQESVTGRAWQKRLDSQAENGIWLAPYVGEPDLELLKRLKDKRKKEAKQASAIPERLSVDKAYSQYLTSAAKQKIRKTIRSLDYLGIYKGKEAEQVQSSDVKQIRILDEEDVSGIKKLINPRKRRKGK